MMLCLGDVVCGRRSLKEILRVGGVCGKCVWEMCLADGVYLRCCGLEMGCFWRDVLRWRETICRGNTAYGGDVNGICCE